MVSAVMEGRIIICRECGYKFGEDEAEICRRCHEHICPECQACGCRKEPFDYRSFRR